MAAKRTSETSPELLIQTMRYVAEGGGVAQGARLAGVPYTTFCSRVNAARQAGITVDSPVTRDDSQADSKIIERVQGDTNTLEITRQSKEQIRTLEDLIEACEIDTDIWTIERWVCNKWDMGSTDQAKKPQTTALFQIKVWLKRRVSAIAIRDEIAELKALAKREIKRSRPKGRPATGDTMLELSIYDLHAGKLAWAQETGHTNYDTAIARAYFETALETLLTRTSVYRHREIVLVVGNDLFHADNLESTTTRGTRMAPVIVPIVPGNHDTLTAWHLGDSLECYFHGDKRVQIRNAPTKRKYHQFGVSMLMFTHGDKGKKPNYPQVMAAEQREMWGATRYREAHVGHLHTTQVQEFNGVRVRTLGALCSPDEWHSAEQYVGNLQTAEAFVWHAQEGLIAQATHTVQPSEVDGDR